MNLHNITISEDMQDLLKRMITYDPKDRIIFKKLFSHKFFRSTQDEIKANEEQKFNEGPKIVIDQGNT